MLACFTTTLPDSGPAHSRPNRARRPLQPAGRAARRSRCGSAVDTAADHRHRNPKIRSVTPVTPRRRTCGQPVGIQGPSGPPGSKLFPWPGTNVTVSSCHRRSRCRSAGEPIASSPPKKQVHCSGLLTSSTIGCETSLDLHARWPRRRCCSLPFRSRTTSNRSRLGGAPSSSDRGNYLLPSSSASMRPSRTRTGLLPRPPIAPTTSRDQALTVESEAPIADGALRCFGDQCVSPSYATTKGTDNSSASR